MAIYYVPGWFLTFLASMSAMAFWYQSIVVLSSNLAANDPTKGFCSFIYDSWALSVLIYSGFYFASISMGLSPFSSPFSTLAFAFSLVLSVVLLVPLFTCLFK